MRSYDFPCSDYNFHQDYGDLQVCWKAAVSPQDSIYTFELFVEWNKEAIQMPMVKSFDILAMNWSDNFVATSYTGAQVNQSGVVQYSNKGGNSKWNTNGTGAGISMNVMDNTTDMLTMTSTMTGYFTSKQSAILNMLYIHAWSTVTKEQSMDYVFSKTSDSLGKVLKFNQQSVRNHYATPVTIEKYLTPQYIK